MIYTITNRKGGTGKTATAHALGAGLKNKGRRVLFVDLDSQANLSFSLGAAQHAGAFELLRGACTPEEARQATPAGDLICASEALAAADAVLTDTGKEYRLREGLQPILSSYDDVIIDTPAQLGILAINALTAADAVIIPVQADIYSVQGISLLAEPIRAVQKYTNRDLRVLGLLITRYQARAIISKDMRAGLHEMAAALGCELFKTEIRENVAIKEAAAMRQSIFEYAPRSNGATDYEKFINEVIERGRP